MLGENLSTAPVPIEHISYLAGRDGMGHHLINRVGLNPGWVVNGRLHPKFWDKIRTQSIPIKPRDDIWSFLSREAREAQEELERAKIIYRQELFKLIVPDQKAIEGWLVSFVLEQDILINTPEKLRYEEKIASQDGNFLLADMKRCARLATGFINVT